MTPLRRAQVLIAAGSVPPAVILGLVCLLIGPVVAVIVAVAVLVVAAAWLWVGGQRQVLAAVGGRTADAITEARLINLVDGLCSTAGVRQPRLKVIDDPGLNLLVAGRRDEDAVLAVTTGLLQGLSRIQLEGVLADGLVQIRRGDIVPATVAVATFGLGVRFVLGEGDHDAEIDEAGVALTRYPPALISALETMDREGTAVAGVRSSMAHLWLADPLPGGARTRPPLAERASALRQL